MFIYAFEKDEKFVMERFSGMKEEMGKELVKKIVKDFYFHTAIRNYNLLNAENYYKITVVFMASCVKNNEGIIGTVFESMKKLFMKAMVSEFW